MTKDFLIELIKDCIKSEHKKHRDEWPEIAARKIYNSLFDKSEPIEDVHFKAKLMKGYSFVDYYAKIALNCPPTAVNPEIKLLILEK